MACISENPEDVLKNYILCPEIPIHNSDPEIIKRVPKPERVFSLPSCPASTTLKPKRDFVTGEIIDFVEVQLENAGASAQNSVSLQRAPGPIEEATRGSVMNFPFWPGGFDEPAKNIEELNIELAIETLLLIPPGFTKGLELTSKDHSVNIMSQMEVDLLKSLESENEIIEWLESNKPDDLNTEELEKSQEISETQNDDDLIAETTVPVLEISKTADLRKYRNIEWAEEVDISQPVTDFHLKVPDPARTYPFELDVFQKQAIIKLEERQPVFVAAHTSAGKTVVAEYAIALSQKHMTRAIYTSPIKALSNQKYRDFKNIFNDVGLITGDLQLNPTASCLIMTTEILRSILVCGGDCIRDLEYVILDEVHYINDSDRGHVWEEVIILLPPHVIIIMLSATVPNTVEFANWVGNTKKRKVYVISTIKRPVPLRHYLYVPVGGKSKNNLLLIVDAEGNFRMSNYEEATSKKAAKTNKKPQFGQAQDVTLWKALLAVLQKEDKLPVVAFTLSRSRCDNNARALASTNLNTAREKGKIHIFVKHCLQKLKPQDRDLPQIKSMIDSLERGIGVHHSGILPILKEIVEMLFQDGLVKVLFATETFAMGVNMPARTVVFDSHIKYDGMERRILKTAEYIQMAGRAGRRGHDTYGDAIIVCKKDLPAAHELQAMIMGRPSVLQSQFILRYALILTCHRIARINVEDIMQHSFMEYERVVVRPSCQKRLEVAEEKLRNCKKIPENLQHLCDFYDKANRYINCKKEIMNFFAKELKLGGVVLISHKEHYNKLAVIVWIRQTKLRVLVLDHLRPSTESSTYMKSVDSEPELWCRMLALTPQHQYFHPEGIGHAVLDITIQDIVEITKSNIKIDANVILRNWDERQMERFRNNPPASAVVAAVTSLKELNDSYIANSDAIQTLSLKYHHDDTSNLLDKMNLYEKELRKILPQTNIANFEEEFFEAFKVKTIEKRINDLKYQLSAKNLSTYQEYINKIEVLKDLKYIDEQNEVTLKGKVACEMGQNELMLTELILSDIFKNLNSAEIASLLSSLVFQAKGNEDCKLTGKLSEYQEKFVNISNVIHDAERAHDIKVAEDRLNFGLVEVVYEWACNKPFATIMEKTEFQEGIIVRCIQQLDELLRDVKTAAIRIGNPALQSKMEEASNAIKRDIVFAASLYTSV